MFEIVWQVVGALLVIACAGTGIVLIIQGCIEMFSKKDEDEINQSFDRLQTMIDEMCLPPYSLAHNHINNWIETAITTTTTYKIPRKKFPRKPRYMKRGK
jgi:hypothetical protein